MVTWQRLHTQPTHYRTALLFCCLLWLGLVAQSSLFGAAPFETASFWFAALIYGFVPGLLIFMWLQPEENNWLLLLGMGWVCGMLAQIIVLLLLSVLGVQSWFVAYPVLLPLLAVAVHLKRSKPNSLIGPPLLHVFALLLLIGLATAASLYFSPQVLFQEARFVHHDIPFHAGNIADIMHTWPLSDPRVAGEPQNYHFLYYFVPISIALPTDLPLMNILMQHLPGLGATLLGLQLFNVGWVVSKRAYGGLIVALMILFHSDVGWAITRVFNLESPLQTGSTLAESGYGSFATLFGSIFFATLLLFAWHWLTKETTDAGRAALIVVLAAVSAGTKSSLLPAVLAGLLALIGWRFVTQGRLPSRAISLLLLILPISILVTLAVVLGEGGFTSYIAVKPGAAMVRTPFFQTLTNGDTVSFWQSVALLPVWLVGYLGLGLVGAVVYSTMYWRRLSDLALWTWFALLAGVVVALSFDFFADERFFMDGPQIMLALLTALAVVELRSIRAPSRYIAIVTLLLFTVPILLYVRQRLWAGLGNTAFTVRTLLGPQEPVVDAYFDAIGWMRHNLPKDAILVTSHREIFLSAYAERQTYYETIRVGPLNNALRQQGFTGEYYPERAGVRDAFYTIGDETDLSDEVALLAEQFSAPIFVVVDNVNVEHRNGYRWEVRPLETTPQYDAVILSPVYSNDAIIIYALMPMDK